MSVESAQELKRKINEFDVKHKVVSDAKDLVKKVRAEAAKESKSILAQVMETSERRNALEQEIIANCEAHNKTSINGCYFISTRHSKGRLLSNDEISDRLKDSDLNFTDDQIEEVLDIFAERTDRTVKKSINVKKRA